MFSEHQSGNIGIKKDEWLKPNLREGVFTPSPLPRGWFSPNSEWIKAVSWHFAAFGSIRKMIRHGYFVLLD